jgi:hypothetical protein
MQDNKVVRAEAAEQLTSPAEAAVAAAPEGRADALVDDGHGHGHGHGHGGTVTVDGPRR